MKLDLYVSILSYLEEGLPCFVELLDSGTEKNKQIIGLDIDTNIPNNKQQLNPPDLNNSKVERAKKKEEKTQRQ